LLARNIDRRQCPFQKPASRPDEWMACQVFLVSRLLPDEHDWRVRGAFAENSLRGILP
jgi:hypothetical protein